MGACKGRPDLISFSRLCCISAEIPRHVGVYIFFIFFGINVGLSIDLQYSTANTIYWKPLERPWRIVKACTSRIAPAISGSSKQNTITWVKDVWRVYSSETIGKEPTQYLNYLGATVVAIRNDKTLDAQCRPPITTTLEYLRP